MSAMGVEVKMIVLALAAEQRNRKHSVTDRDGSVYKTEGTVLQRPQKSKQSCYQLTHRKKTSIAPLDS